MPRRCMTYLTSTPPQPAGRARSNPLVGAPPVPGALLQQRHSGAVVNGPLREGTRAASARVKPRTGGLKRGFHPFERSDALSHYADRQHRYYRPPTLRRTMKTRRLIVAAAVAVGTLGIST